MGQLSKRDGAFNPEQAGMLSLASGYFKMKGDGRIETGKLVDALRSGRPIFVPSWFESIQVDDEIEIAADADPVVWRGSGKRCHIQQTVPGIMAARLLNNKNQLSNLHFQQSRAPLRSDIGSEGYGSDATFSRPAGLLIAGNGNTVSHVSFKDWIVGIRLRAADRATGYNEDNTFFGIECEGHLFGMLITNARRLLINTIRGSDTNVRGANQPPHTVYLAGPASIPDGAIAEDDDNFIEVGFTRSEFVRILNMMDDGNPQASSFKARGVDGLTVSSFHLNNVARGLDIAYSRRIEISDFHIRLAQGKSYHENPADQTLVGINNAQSGINFQYCRDGLVLGGSVSNATGHDLCQAVFIRSLSSGIEVHGTHADLTFSGAAGDGSPFRAAGVSDCGFYDVTARDYGASSTTPMARFFGTTNCEFKPRRWLRANTTNIPIIVLDSGSVGDRVILNPASLPAGVTVASAVFTEGRGTRLDVENVGIPRRSLVFAGDPADGAVAPVQIWTNGSAAESLVQSDGTRWKFQAGGGDAQTIAVTLQPTNTLVGAVTNVAVSTVNVRWVKFQIFDSGNNPVGDPRYVDVVTSDGYATGTANYSKQILASGTGLYVKASAWPSATPFVNTSAFDAGTDVGDLFIPSDLGSALALAVDANDVASAYVSGGLVTEFRHLYDSTKKLTASVPQALLTAAGRDGTKKAVQCLSGNYFSGTFAELLAAADTTDIQTGNWAMTMGFAASSGQRRLGGWFALPAGGGIYFRQNGSAGRQALLSGSTGGIQVVGPSPAVADDSLYHVLIARKVGNSIKLYLDAFVPGSPYASATITATGTFNPTVFAFGAYGSGGVLVPSAVNGLCAAAVVAGTMSDTDLSYLARWTARKTGMVIPPL